MDNFFDLAPPESLPSERNSRMPIPEEGGVLITFFEFDEYQGYKSKVEGRPVYEKKDYIRKVSDNNSDFQRRVKDKDKLVYAKQWAAYQANKDSQGVIGTMLDYYAKASGNLSNPELQNLRANKIYTVEQLAGLSDVVLQNLGMGARKQRSDAAVWLEELKTGTVERKLTESLESLKKEIEIKNAALKETEESYKARLEDASKKIEELASMNETVLEQYSALAGEVDKLKKKKK